MINITLADLMQINSDICSDNDSQSVVINENNLLSALSVQQWYPEPCLCASALIRSITIGHGFQDGNKRTASIVGMMVLMYECAEDIMINCILDIAAGKLKDVDTIASILYPDSHNYI